MRYLLACGGTGGHINPAIAIADELKKKDPEAQFLFVGNEDGMEQKLVPRAGYPIRSIRAHGFARGGGAKNLLLNVKYAWRAIQSVRRARRILRQFRPDLAIGTGGYVSGPVMLAARELRIPYVIHEQNAYAGVATRACARSAARVFLSFEHTIGVEPGENVRVVGNPVRGGFLPQPAPGRAEEKPLVLSCGGSLGARAINEAMCGLLALSHRDGRLRHLHAAGSSGYAPMMSRLKELGVPTDGTDGIEVREFIYDMADRMREADVVIARAGAITLAEIAAMGKPSILIPSPNVAENHQYHNARVFRDAGAALLIEEKDLTGEGLYAALLEVACSSDRRAEMARAARRVAYPHAAQDIADEILALLRGA